MISNGQTKQMKNNESFNEMNFNEKFNEIKIALLRNRIYFWIVNYFSNVADL